MSQAECRCAGDKRVRFDIVGTPHVAPVDFDRECVHDTRIVDSATQRSDIVLRDRRGDKMAKCWCNVLDKQFKRRCLHGTVVIIDGNCNDLRLAWAVVAVESPRPRTVILPILGDGADRSCDGWPVVGVDVREGAGVRRGLSLVDDDLTMRGSHIRDVVDTGNGDRHQPLVTVSVFVDNPVGEVQGCRFRVLVLIEPQVFEFTVWIVGECAVLVIHQDADSWLTTGDRPARIDVVFDVRVVCQYVEGDRILLGSLYIVIYSNWRRVDDGEQHIIADAAAARVTHVRNRGRASRTEKVLDEHPFFQCYPVIRKRSVNGVRAIVLNQYEDIVFL